MSTLKVSGLDFSYEGAWLTEAAANVSKPKVDHIFEQSRKIFDQGNGIESAFLAPITQFVVDATLIALNQDRLARQIPEEIDLRHIVAKDVAQTIIARMVAEGEVISLYRETALYKDMDSIDKELLSDEDHLKTLTNGAFSDGSVVAGGAYNLLDHEGVPQEQRPQIIKDSKGLLVVSKIDLDDADAVYGILGQPYVYARNLVFEPGRSKVRFTPQIAQLMLNDYRGDGCPVGMMKALDVSGNVLQQSWEEMVDYLVPEDATTILYREPEAVAA